MTDFGRVESQQFRLERIHAAPTAAGPSAHVVEGLAGTTSRHGDARAVAPPASVTFQSAAVHKLELPPETVLPTQWHSALSDGSPVPEELLLLAILEEAIATVQRYVVDERRRGRRLLPRSRGVGVIRRREPAMHVPQHLRRTRYRSRLPARGRDALVRATASKRVRRLSVLHAVPPSLRLAHSDERSARRGEAESKLIRKTFYPRQLRSWAATSSASKRSNRPGRGSRHGCAAAGRALGPDSPLVSDVCARMIGRAAYRAAAQRRSAARLGAGLAQTRGGALISSRR